MLALSFWAQIYFVLAFIHLFDITKCSKWLNRMGSNREGEGGAVGRSGNILVKSYIPKSKFDNVFDITKDYSLYIKI